jgi:hypothetical protein
MAGLSGLSVFFSGQEGLQALRLNIWQGVRIMLEVTELATQNLKSYMDQNNIDSALRVAIMGGG